MSALGSCLPSFVIILLIALFFQHFREYPLVDKVFRGIRPAVVALIAAPVFKIGKGAHITRTNVWIPISAALAIWLLGFNPIFVILIAGLGGYAYGQFTKEGE